MQRQVFLTLAWALVLGCGGKAAMHAPTPPATTGAHAYMSALRADNARQAYELLSKEIRTVLSFEEFARQWKQSEVERAQQAKALEDALAVTGAGQEHATVVYGDGKIVHLVREQGEWRLQSPVVPRYHAGQPGDAIEHFAAALAARDYEAILQTLTERRRKGIDDQVRRFAGSLADALESGRTRMELISDDRAELRWDDGRQRYRLVLRKEGDDWRVDDVHMRPMPNADRDDR